MHEKLPRFGKNRETPHYTVAVTITFGQCQGKIYELWSSFLKFSKTLDFVESLRHRGYN